LSYVFSHQDDSLQPASRTNDLKTYNLQAPRENR
jgi:hypothetical protein